MARIDSLHPSLLAAGFLAGALGIAGCMSAHPDNKSAVINALGSNSPSGIMVAEDRQEGVITLTGDASSNDAKAQAATIAATAAPGYTIDNRIKVTQAGISDRPVASNKPKPRASTRLKLASTKLM